MINKILNRATFIICSLGMVLVVPLSVEARHKDYSFSRQISSLDDDVVETFAIPILFGVSLKNIVPNFGDMRGGGTRTHEGQDIMATLGTPIVTPTEAVVTSTGFGDSAGNYVYTANPGEEMFRYMHLDEIADIEPGDVLKAGDFIGTVGDTGNAKGAGSHLHFEIKTNEFTDPYPRIQEELTLKEKIVIIKRMFGDIDNEREMAKFLVVNFQSDFQEALNKGYDLPAEIKTELKKGGTIDNSKLVEQLEKVIASIPTLVTKDLVLGADGVEVRLLQIFLIYQKSGLAAATLSRSGATGYFGPVTENALKEYQEVASIKVSGIYDAKTRLAMVADYN